MKRFRFVLLILILSGLLLSASCITINPPPAQAPTPTPTPTQVPSLPSIESFIADPNYNPGGSKLAGLSDVKIVIDNVWQQRYGQTYYQTSPALGDAYKPNDMSQLQKVLNELNRTPWVSLYKLNYFDCSDMSALLQRELTIRGFESWIVIGKDPNVRSGHAWVVVFLRSPSIRLVPVEATQLEIPQSGKEYRFVNGVAQTYEDYSRQGWVLQDVYQAIAYQPTGEFDWWNRTDILQKLGLPTIATPTPPPLLTYNLNVSVSPQGSGSVSPTGGQYTAGTQVTVTATPASGYTFSYWSGNVQFSGTASNSPSITLTMNSNVNIVANFFVTAPLSVGFTGWYVGGTKVDTTTKGNTVVARIVVSGGSAGQYTMRIRRDIAWADDQTVKELTFNHDGTPLTRELSFIPPYATGEASTNGYHIDLIKDGYIVWTLTNAYPPRLRVTR